MSAVLRERTLDQVDQFRLELTQKIDEKIRAKYRTQIEAENALDISQCLISQIRHGRYERFSMAWLVGLATRLGMRVSLVTVDVSIR